ncbi:MAG: xanthine dehydrogenase family protein molybdopterin-binding subunit [Dehalococcoidales bacterium]|nr:xanthine dehydrogenase family protein molybdopterin-binding subunit [Dehalococcoidales bacterium]
MSNVLGKDHTKKDIALKVTGKAEYTGDIRLPGMLECRILKSPYGHARILSIDTSEAEKLPGVKAVVTHKDSDIILPQPLRTGGRNEYYTLPPAEVFMTGEQVAAVAAETKEIAVKALKLIKVEYEPLPAVYDPEDALKPDAPVIYSDLTDNRIPMMFPLVSQKGDVTEGFENTDVTLQSRYHWPTWAQCPLEPYQTVARWEGDNLTVWISTQTLWDVQDYISGALGLPVSKITVINKWVGGGFGGKYGPSQAMPACIVAALAKKAGRPVRSLLEMEEQFVVSHHACGPGYWETKGGIKLEDGRPVALDTTVNLTIGGHAAHEPAAILVTGQPAANVYNYDNTRATVNVAYCNINMAGPKRSYGDAEGMFCSEQFADEMAEAAGMNPLEWRKKWCNKAGDPFSQYSELAGGNYIALMTKAAEAFNWEERWKGWKTPTAVNGDRKRGIGMALSMHTTGGGTSGSLVRINIDGTVDVVCAAEDIGQGIKTATAMCVAEVLGVRYEDVSVAEDNTKYSPRGGGVYGSKGTPTNIGGSINAAINSKAVLMERAAILMEEKQEDLELKNGKICSKNNPEKSMTIGSVAGSRRFGGAGIYVYGEETSSHKNPETGRTMTEKSLAAVCCEVEVDTGTGQVDVLEIAMACDCGAAINPEVITGQCDSGMMQGVANALYEDLLFDKGNEGIITNVNLVDFKIPTFPEFKNFSSVIHADPADAPTTPLNVKGMGESTIVGIAPAIANAVYNAIGARIKSGPLTPDKILEALGKV